MNNSEKVMEVIIFRTFQNFSELCRNICLQCMIRRPRRHIIIGKVFLLHRRYLIQNVNIQWTFTIPDIIRILEVHSILISSSVCHLAPCHCSCCHHPQSLEGVEVSAPVQNRGYAKVLLLCALLAWCRSSENITIRVRKYSKLESLPYERNKGPRMPDCSISGFSLFNAKLINLSASGNGLQFHQKNWNQLVLITRVSQSSWLWNALGGLSALDKQLGSSPSSCCVVGGFVWSSQKCVLVLLVRTVFKMDENCFQIKISWNFIIEQDT